MSQNIFISQILVYNDVPEVFIATDGINTDYICLLVNSQNSSLNYVSTAISSKRLTDFIEGAIDLKSIFQFLETGQWFMLNKIDENYEVGVLNTSDIPNSLLPDSGFYISKN